MKKLHLVFLCVFCAVKLTAESINAFGLEELPLKKVTLYSSGVAHYIHEGDVSGSGEIQLMFSPSQINDVLKSLVIMDPAAKKLIINYRSEDTLKKTLESLNIDISSAKTIYDILKAQKGAEIEIVTSKQLTGKILSVDKNEPQESAASSFISIISKDGIHIIPFSEIQFFKFKDENKNKDLNAALDLILADSIKNRKKLGINIESESNRKVKLSYVMEAPIWKPTYRLDMGLDKATFQAWAIVDNSTDLDWNNIKLTLTTGRPIGFKQNLYPPYYTERPEMPLSIAQTAEVETFDSNDYTAESFRTPPMASSNNIQKKPKTTYFDFSEYSDKNESAYFDNQIEIKKAEEMFAFTPSQPISLERQQSIMIPLSLSNFPAEKCSVFSSIPYNTKINPKFCIQIENTSGLKLPAGPITVFDNGKYAGDALVEFLPENEKRLIAYGDDIEITGRRTDTDLQNIQTIKVVNGIVISSYKHIQSTKYDIKNSDKNDRTIVIEHTKRNGFELKTKNNLIGTSGNKYIFKLKAQGNSNSELKIQEEKIYEETKKISEMNHDAFVYYASNSAIPEKINKIFNEIIKEQKKVSEKKQALEELMRKNENISKDQDRVRKNLEAVGSETQQGKDFLNKLLKLENELETLKIKIIDYERDFEKAQKEFKEFLNGITIE